MSDPGMGRAVDALDEVCESYKKCLKCARSKFGGSCIPEFSKYKFGESKSEIICKDKRETCRSALCECDLKFAKRHAEEGEVWNSDYHMFWSRLPTGWNPRKGSCPEVATEALVCE